MSTDELAGARAAALAALAERAPSAYAALQAAGPEIGASAGRVLVSSDFVLDTLCRDPSLMSRLLEGSAQRFGGALPPPSPPADADAEGEALFMAQLRRWRHAELTRIAWRDLAGWAALRETLAELSAAAEQAVCAALELAVRRLTVRHGRPRSAAGAEQQLIVVAMGKLGGRELNFSSDIDLVLLYPEGGQTDGPRLLSNEQFFTRLGQALIRLLAQQTEDGLVYRVDLRLRPLGASGPLVVSAAGLEDYLQRLGRDWERYAWVKARAITNVQAYAELFRTVVRPFVYRRYLDFGVFESLREMKQRIERQVRRRELQQHIKLGDGGIREIEFIVQTHQLIRGGQDQRLQTSSLQSALPRLAGAKLLPAAAVAELSEAYRFLRRLENRLQMRADRQEHTLPSEPAEQLRLAAAMGLESWGELAQQLAEHRGRVAARFRAMAFEGGDVHAAGPSELPDVAEAAALQQRLTALGFADCDAARRLLVDFQGGSWRLRLDESGRRRLAALLPALLAEAAGTAEPLATLRRLLRVLEAIGARSTYFSLLRQNARARARLVQLAAHGDFLTGQIAAHPLLLDELIDERIFEQRPDRVSLAADLEQRLAGADEGDEERLVETLTHFRRAAVFRVAVADLLASLPVMQVSDRLTDIAELIIERALALAWRQLTPQLGVPMCGAGTARRAVRLCVVGYGKLGGMELGYASDLDLVFLHDSNGARQETEGARSLDNQVFFVRFAQRLVHLLTMHSAAGRLYEVDMRLRPGGKGGLLITRLEAFAAYQRREAWTWEHQALLHARSVAGDAALRARFEAVRIEVLTRHVRRERLREDVRHMRTRMRHELSRARAGQFDLKQDAGGIADIEFLAQYWALDGAPGHPALVHFSDTIRQLESVASADLVAQQRIDVLTHAYRVYRERLHHRALDGQGDVLDAREFQAERAAVTAIWNEVMG